MFRIGVCVDSAIVVFRNDIESFEKIDWKEMIIVFMCQILFKYVIFFYNIILSGSNCTFPFIFIAIALLW